MSRRKGKALPAKAEPQRRLMAAPQRRIQVVATFGGFPARGQHSGARSDKKILRNWQPREQSADQDNLGDVSVLRGRSYDAARSQPLGAGAILTQRRNVVGTGLVPQSRIDREDLGLTKESADQWQRRADKLWWLHANSPAIDASGRHTFGIKQNLALASLLLGGDVLLVRRWKPRPRQLFSTCIQIYEAHRICTPTGKQESETLRHGVEMDLDGEPIAFYVKNESPSGDYLNGRSFIRIPARSPSGDVQAILVSDPSRPGETRGVPYLAPVLEQLRGLSEYLDNEILASVLQSLLTFFLETPAAGTSEFPGLGTPIDPAETAAATGSDDEKEILIGNGQLAEGMPGEKLNMLNPARPNPNVEQFFNAVATAMAPALGLSRGVILKRFDASYSAARGELQEAWRDHLARREVFISQFCAPVRDWWLEEAVDSGLLEAPGFIEDTMLRAAWSYCEWTGPVPATLDPLKEVNAARFAVDAGFQSRQSVAAKLYGADWHVEHEQLVTENDARKAAGLDETPDFASAAKSESTSTAIVPGQDEPKETDGEEDDSE